MQQSTDRQHNEKSAKLPDALPVVFPDFAAYVEAVLTRAQQIAEDQNETLDFAQVPDTTLYHFYEEELLSSEAAAVRLVASYGEPFSVWRTRHSYLEELING